MGGGEEGGGIHSVYNGSQMRNQRMMQWIILVCREKNTQKYTKESAPNAKELQFWGFFLGGGLSAVAFSCVCLPPPSAGNCSSLAANEAWIWSTLVLVTPLPALCASHYNSFPWECILTAGRVYSKALCYARCSCCSLPMSVYISNKHF